MINLPWSSWDALWHAGLAGMINHIPSMAVLAFVLWWLYPILLRNALNNGAGNTVRTILKAENVEQSRVHSEELRAHEQREDAKFADHARSVIHRLDRIEDRLYPPVSGPPGGKP